MVDTLSSATGSNTVACNRRSSARHALRANVIGEVRRPDDRSESNLAFSFLDLSEGGACAVLTEELQRGEVVELKFTFGDLALRGTAVVRWVQRLDERLFCVGVRFQKRLSYKDVAPFFKP